MNIKKFLKKNYKLLILATLAFMFVVSVLNAWNDSAIFDETAHIGAAYSYVTQHEIRLNPEHPPLIKDLAGLPLLILHPNFNVANQPFWTGTLPNKWDEGQWASGRYLLYQAGNNPDKIIFWARLPIILLSLIFGLFLFKWGRELGGISAGLLALVFYAFDPNILGHNHFVTTDLGIAAFFTFSFYFYLKFIKNPAWKNVLLAGIFLGLLFLTKFSFLIALPIFGLVTIIYPLITNVPSAGKKPFFKIKKLGEYLGKGALIFALSLIVVWCLYAANTFRMTGETVAQSIENNFPATDTSNVRAVYTNKALHWLNGHAITRPFTEFGIGVAYVFRRVSGGNGAYFMGQVSGTAFRAYFPTVFSIKEPLPLLFLMIFALFFSFFEIARTILASSKNFIRETLEKLARYLRSNIAEFSMVLFVALYAYVSITGNLNIGFRHLFPILPFIYLLTAKNVVRFLEEKREKHSYLIFSSALAILIAYFIIGTAAAYPNYISYFNETAGGPKNGYRYVTDSNADWGQDLKRLKNFLDKHPEIDKIRVDYFGGGDIGYYIGNKYIKWWDSKRPIEKGWYAISTNFLQGSIYSTEKTDADSYRWLKNKRPLYQVGTSIFIYKVD